MTTYAEIYYKFQFHNGSIKSAKYIFGEYSNIEVSIPQWFD